MDCNQCDWIFDATEFYIQDYTIMDPNGINKIKTIEYHDWLYCHLCKSFVGRKGFNRKYPAIISLSLNHYLIKDVVNEILLKYHRLK
jgi:hypothetical protein